MKLPLLALCCIIIMSCVPRSDFSTMTKEQKEKHLIKLSREVTQAFGPGYYREGVIPVISEGVFESDDSRPEATRNIGRAYYMVTFPYDTTKESLDFDYSSQVRIWKDTGEPLDVLFGNGWGKNCLFMSYQEMLANKESIGIIPYQQAFIDTTSIYLEDNTTAHLTYSQEELRTIQEKLNTQWSKLQHDSAMRNVQSTALIQDYIEINLIVNTPEMQKEFREKVMDSSAFKFVGLATPAECSAVGVSDTLGVYLYSEFPVYSTSTAQVKFILSNRSGIPVMCGEEYFITYKDENNIWRRLPINDFSIAVGYSVSHNGDNYFNAKLYPDLHANKPGRYRFFYDVRIGNFKPSSVARINTSR